MHAVQITSLIITRGTPLHQGLSLAHHSAKVRTHAEHETGAICMQLPSAAEDNPTSMVQPTAANQKAPTELPQCSSLHTSQDHSQAPVRASR
mmetsp:Transcript_20999/g.53391  ORF Transcript_20999/g.53391 Transcript_20999/m.53391 type:complete len:92 (-) Transcript_20999:4036-4311(-)